MISVWGFRTGVSGVVGVCIRVMMRSPFGRCLNRNDWSQLTLSSTDRLQSVAAAKFLQVVALVEQY